MSSIALLDKPDQGRVEKMALLTVLAVFLLAPYLPYMTRYLNQEGGKISIPFIKIGALNVWLFLATGLAVAAQIHRYKLSDLLLFISVSVLAILILAARIFIYRDVSASGLSYFRPAFTILLYWFMAEALMKRPGVKSLLSKIIVANSLIHAIIGILIQQKLLALPFLDNAVRMSGILFSPAVYANLSLLGILTLIFAFNVTNKRSEILRTVCLLILFYAVFISKTRVPLVFAIAILSLHVLAKDKTVWFKPLVLLAISAALLNLFFNKTELIKRVLMLDDGGRFLKNVLGMSVLLQDFTAVVIGPALDASQVTLPGGEGISDNSFIEMALKFGIVFMAIWSIVLFSAITKMVRPFSLKSVFIILYVLSCFFLTNCLLWDAWVYYLFPTINVIMGRYE